MKPTIVYDFDPRNLPDSMLIAIGLVAACSAQTENIVEQGIAGCVGTDFEYGYALTTHMSTPHRDHVLRSVAEIRIDDLDDLDTLDMLLDEIEKAFKKRNAYVHHSWCRNEETGQCFTVKTTARGRVEMDLVPMTVDQVKGDAAFIFQAGLNLLTFLSPRNLLPLFTPTPRPRGHKSKAARRKRRKAALNE